VAMAPTGMTGDDPVAADPQDQAGADQAGEAEHGHGEGALGGEAELEVEVGLVALLEAAHQRGLGRVGAGGADAGVALEHAVGQAGEHLEGDADERVEAADDVDGVGGAEGDRDEGPQGQHVVGAPHLDQVHGDRHGDVEHLEAGEADQQAHGHRVVGGHADQLADAALQVEGPLHRQQVGEEVDAEAELDVAAGVEEQDPREGADDDHREGPQHQLEGDRLAGGEAGRRRGRWAEGVEGAPMSVGTRTTA
jgi:hypothetical protein